MKYFTKYLPVEGKTQSNNWEWYNNVKNTGWESTTPSDMDAIIAHGLIPAPQFRKVKLFLCSRDIKVGDECYTVRPDYFAGPWICDKVDEKEVIHMEYACCIYTERGYAVKKIAEISSDTKWVKEWDEFDETEVEFWCYPPFSDGYTQSLEEWITKEDYYKTIKLKCRCCKNFS